ncbi:MAG: DUF4910 domain-containing protein [Saprospiraceae bacterium]|nr:DUF4910 domain-containing protein [Saprospiraceae bacterium]
MYALAERLYPICRSITGEGVRETLRILQEYAPISIHEVPTGTQVFDWEVPKEWNISQAWIKNSAGEKVVDFMDHSLHVLSYSIPIHKILPLSQLRDHLYSLPDQPDLIPYRTSYYQSNWGFCLSHRQLEALEDGDYEVCISSSLEAGSLTYAEYLLPGRSKDEFIFSTHVCHPSLANDNLSGVVMLIHLLRKLQHQDLRYSYRFLFVPGTIGSICWLAQNADKLATIKGGLIASLLGDGGKFHYKLSRHEDSIIDKVAQFVLTEMEVDHEVIPFSPYGYDERQYGSPGINLAVGSLTRSTFGSFPQYHTSADNLDFIQPRHLAQSYQLYSAVVDLLELNRTYVNLSPMGEPQLGRRGLYDAIGGASDQKAMQMAILWVLNMSDGTHDAIDVAHKSNLPSSLIVKVCALLLDKGLLRESD